MRHERFPFVDGPSDLHGRRDDRVELSVLADIKFGAGEWRRARLQDVSVSGFRLAGVPRAVDGLDLRIRIPGLTVLSATVRRRSSHELGCEFNHPLSIYVLEHMARHRA